MKNISYDNCNHCKVKKEGSLKWSTGIYKKPIIFNHFKAFCNDGDTVVCIPVVFFKIWLVKAKLSPGHCSALNRKLV